MEDGGLGALLARHKREQKALVSQITSLKKTVTKGEKSKRKEVLAEVERLENELKERHQRELNEAKGPGEVSKDGVPANFANGKESISPELTDIAKLKLEEAPRNANNCGKPKVSRQKARLVNHSIASHVNTV